MKPRFLFLLMLLAGNTVYGTQMAKKSLQELVDAADHVMIGTVKSVKMYEGAMGDSHGGVEIGTGGREEWTETKDPEARTGPGDPNELRWTVAIDSAGVLYSKRKDVPAEIVIRQWTLWHKSLFDSRKHEGKTYLFLLKGDDMQWVYPAGYYRELTERPEIERFLQAKSGAR